MDDDSQFLILSTTTACSICGQKAVRTEVIDDYRVPVCILHSQAEWLTLEEASLLFHTLLPETAAHPRENPRVNERWYTIRRKFPLEGRKTERIPSLKTTVSLLRRSDVLDYIQTQVDRYYKNLIRTTYHKRYWWQWHRGGQKVPKEFFNQLQEQGTPTKE